MSWLSVEGASGDVLVCPSSWLLASSADLVHETPTEAVVLLWAL